MRLIDLHCNWAMQYVGETIQYEAGLYEQVRDRLAQLDGYLSGTAAAVLSCGRNPADWAAQVDPWRTLSDMIARHEAEFSGRLLIGPDDLKRWKAEPPAGLCWGILGVRGLDSLVRAPRDLDRLAGLFDRGVRIFQLVDTGASLLGGAGVSGDDCGLSELGQAFLARLADLAPAAGTRGPRPVIDVAALNERTTGDVLSWFEADSSRRARLKLVRSHGALATTPGTETSAAGLSAANLQRFRAIGGLLGLSPGLPHFPSTNALRDALRAAAEVPFEGHSGYQGLAIGTDFLNLEQPLEGCGNVEEVLGWLATTFDAQTTDMLARSSAARLFAEAAGAGIAS